MDQWIIRAVSVVVLLSAVALSWWHLRQRRKHRRSELPPDQYDYFRRQFRRRIQVSTMLGILAVLMAVESWAVQTVVVIVTGVGMFVLLLWIMLLAVIDAFASRLHYERLRSNYMVEQAKLEAEARRLRGVGGNGKARTNPTEPEPEDIC